MISSTTPELSVFVPAMLTLGLLVSVGALVRDAIHRLRGQQWLDRRAAMNGRAMALLTVKGELALQADRFGRRSRLFYGCVAGACIGLACYLLVGSYGNYIGWTGWVATIAWIWLGYLVMIGVFAGVGAWAAVIVVRWAAPPAWTRPVLAHTPLSSVDVANPRLERRRYAVRPPHPSRPRLLGPQQIDARRAALLRTAAALWTMTAVIVLSLLAFQDRLPQASDPGILETAVSGPVQIGLLALISVGSLICGRHEPTGAAIMAAAGWGLAFMSAVQYPPWVAVGVALAFGTPAFLHWLAWQRDRHVHHLVVLAATAVMLVAGVGVSADALYDTLLGPSHPDSLTSPQRTDVAWAWAGNTTSHSATVVVKAARPASTIRLVVAEGPSATIAAPDRVLDGDAVTAEIVRFDVAGLQPNRTYSYGAQIDGRQDATDGSFRTFPDGAADFTIAFGSCSRTGSNGAVFDAIRAQDPLLFLAIGDLGYSNVRGDDLERFLRAYDRTLEAPAQAALYRSTSVGYVWDDHDYGGNDADRTSASRSAAQASYRLVTPHAPLAAPEGDGAIYHAFPVGRIRVVMTDLRSHRDPEDVEADDRTMLGAAQMAWFEGELRAAAVDGQAVLWASASPWIEESSGVTDSWAAFPAERQRIGRLVRELGLADRLLMVAGDAHMAAFDDGTHAAYDGPESGFPVVHAGALDRPGGTKGGPYTVGPFPGGGQFGTFEVHDDGGPTIEVTVTARTWSGATLFEEPVRLRVG